MCILLNWFILSNHQDLIYHLVSLEQFCNPDIIKHNQLPLCMTQLYFASVWVTAMETAAEDCFFCSFCLQWACNFTFLHCKRYYNIS